MPGYEALLADEQGNAVARGEIGNLLIAGDSTCSQYWNKHERTKNTILGAWIQTGDKYYQDEVIGGPGAFMIVARSYETFADAILKKLIAEIASNSR